MRWLSFDGMVATFAILLVLALPAVLVYECWFDRVEAYYPIQAKMLQATFRPSHTDSIWNGKSYTLIYHADEYEYHLQSDPISGDVYFFWLTSEQDYSKINPVTVHYGFCRLSKKIKFRWSRNSNEIPFSKLSVWKTKGRA